MGASLLSTASSASSLSLESSSTSTSGNVLRGANGHHHNNNSTHSNGSSNHLSNHNNSSHSNSTHHNNSNNGNNGGPIINGQLVENSPLKKNSPDFYIIRVTYETDQVELDGIVLYKSIMLGNNERTPQVIRNAMLKLSMEGNPDNYTLSQVLPEKELKLPQNANVYYAVNTQHNLNFILRPKKATE